MYGIELYICDRILGASLVGCSSVNYIWNSVLGWENSVLGGFSSVLGWENSVLERYSSILGCYTSVLYRLKCTLGTFNWVLRVLVV